MFDNKSKQLLAILLAHHIQLWKLWLNRDLVHNQMDSEDLCIILSDNQNKFSFLPIEGLYGVVLTVIFLGDPLIVSK